MLKMRIITALILLAILLPVVFLMPIQALYILLSMVIGFASWEWGRLITPTAKVLHYLYATLMMFSLYLIWYFGAFSSNPVHFYMAQLIVLFCAFVFWLLVVPFIIHRGVNLQTTQVTKTLFYAIGFVIFPACWFALAVLRELGLGVFLSVLVWVWAADVGAYFSGKKFGRVKLAPTVSPGKTVEGVLGGLILVLLVVTAAVYYSNFFPNYFGLIYNYLGWGGVFAIAIVGSLLSVMGDLFESQLKRLAGVKDSSHLLPGHGGFLDRIDALLPVLPFAALIFLILSN